MRKKNFSMKPKEEKKIEISNRNSAMIENISNFKNNINIDKNNCNNCNVIIGSINHIYLPEFEVYFHLDHFNCKICNLSLTKEYYEKNKNFYCLKCYNKRFLPTCPECEDPIVSDYLMLNNIKYHKECLACISCDKVLDNRCFIRELKKFCYACFINLNNICNKCKDPISDSNYFDTFKNEKYHAECFKCDICNDEFYDEESYICYNNNPLHKNCYLKKYGTKCTKCKEYIKGKYYENKEKTVICHEECLND